MFPPPYRANLQDSIFLKRINHSLLMFFSPTLIFFKMTYSQSDETGILEIKVSFTAQPWWADFRIFMKFFCGFYTFVVVS